MTLARSLGQILIKSYFYPAKNLGLSFLAIVLISFCFIAGSWQWERGVERRTQNDLIRMNMDLPIASLPTESALEESRRMTSFSDLQWRKFQVSGKFLVDNEIYLRNRYFQNQYGFGVTTLFQLLDGRKVWIDRGWVKAGASATEIPQVKPVPDSNVNLEVRFRSDALEAKISGSFFATGQNRDQLSRWNQEARVDSEDFYFDLIGGDFLPDFPTPLPTLSNGPHFAYAIQWWFFALLVLFGRWLIAREERRSDPAARR